jgi:ketosteroid isomerase-like protein
MTSKTLSWTFLLISFLFFSVFSTSAQSDRKAMAEQLLQQMLGEWEIDMEESNFNGLENVQKLHHIYQPLKHDAKGVEGTITYIVKDEEEKNTSFISTRIFAFDENNRLFSTYVYSKNGMVRYDTVEIVNEQTMKISSKIGKNTSITTGTYEGDKMKGYIENYNENGELNYKSYIVMRRVQPDMSEEEKITAEILAAQNQLFEAFRNGDVDKILSMHRNTPEYRNVWGAKVRNYEQMAQFMKTGREKSWESIDYKMEETQINVIDPENVILFAPASASTALKNGETIDSGPMYVSTLWQKIDGAWMLGHIHASWPPKRN